MKRPTVSLCMIVRDEGECLGRCLASAQSLVQEIIVVDTGSQDNTREVAAAWGAQVFEYRWEDDFAKARNFSLQQARGEWILVLDADEEMARVGPQIWQELLKDDGVEGYYLPIRSRLGAGEWTEDYVVRLFRNKPEYRFVGALHEQVAGAIQAANQGGGLMVAPLTIGHYGYLPERIVQKEKGRRNRETLEKALAEQADNPFLLYSLGTEYLQAGQWAKACASLEQAVTLLTGKEGYFQDALILFLMGLIRGGEGAKALQWLEGSLGMFPEDPDLHLLRGLALLQQEGGVVAALAELELAMKGESRLFPRHGGWNLVGELCHSLGLLEKSEEAYLAALASNPRQVYLLKNIIALPRRRELQDWLFLARFAPLSEKWSIAKELIRMSEYPLAMLVGLLAVLDAPDGERAQGCQAFREGAQAYATLEESPLWQGAYLRLLGEELCLYGDENGLPLAGSGLFPTPSLQGLAKSGLELVGSMVCAQTPNKVRNLP